MAPQPLEPVAVIGMSCRFAAGANNPEKLWSLMSEGKSGWQDVPSDRFNWKSFYHPDPNMNGTTNHRGGHFLDQDISEFDSAFFGYPPSEAHAIDPQQRIQLETAYEALENAGVPIEQVRGSNTAVYIATFSSDYERMMFKDISNTAKYHMTGVGSAIASNRISYFFDLKGPSITLDTGCSGSLVALHQACQSLQTGESSMALVGGTNLILSPDSMIPMSLLHILNTDGRCYSFDSRGSGYGRGEGVATVVLKRLKDALEAGDSVRAIIRGSGVNQDGKTPGITVPNQDAQQSLIRSVYSRAGLDPRDTVYVEAHGTGTVAGDMTEVKSIINSFCTERKTPLYLGSIKSNIGHLESASGIAGLIKAILVLEKGLIPPSVNLKDVKKDLRLDAQKIKVEKLFRHHGQQQRLANSLQIARTLEPWPSTDHETRYASVNSFGYGGTNAHVILQAAPLKCTGMPETGLSERNITVNGSRRSGSGPDVRSHADGDEEDLVGQCNRGEDSIGTDYGEENAINSQPLSRRAGTPQLLAMTAKSERSLLEMLENLATWVTDFPQKDDNLRDLAYTLSSRRSLMSWRYSIVVTAHHDLASLRQGLPQVNKASTDVRITFLFTGQGAQWFAMGRELILIHCEFRNSIDKSCRILRDLGAPWNLVRELLREKYTSRLHKSDIAQPCTTAIQIALVDLFNHLGIQPGIVLGHSSGEIAAAYAAGVLSQADALNISYQRGIISNGSKKGAMLAVGLGEEDAMRQISQVQKGTVCVACINSHSSTTISGDEDAIMELKAILDSKSIFNKRLEVDVAYHSQHMREVARQYLGSLQALNFTAPSASVKFISSVTGVEKFSDFGPSYWVQNLVSKVRFSDALEACCRAQLVDAQHMSVTTMFIFLELGPHSALSGPTNQTIKQLNLSSFRHSYVPSLVRGENAIHAVMRLAGSLFELGHSTRFEVINSLDGNQHPCSVVQDIPPYPWDHSCKYWHESQMSKDDRLRQYPYHDLLGFRIVGGTSYGRHWRHIISIENLPWLREHIIDNSTTFPGAGYLCMAIEGILQIVQDRRTTEVVHNIVIRDIVFSRALILPASPAKTEIQLSLIPPRNGNNRDSTGWEEFCVSSLSQDGVWSEHCRGFIMVEFGSPIDGEQANYEEGLDATDQRERFLEMKEQCTQRLDTHVLYDELRSNGNAYGSSFAILEDIHIGVQQAVGNVLIPDIAACMPSAFMQPHTIHPTTLDAVFHIAIPLFRRHSALGSVMPVSIKRISISAGLNSQVGEKLLVGATLLPEGRRVATTDILAFQSKSLSEIAPVITISQAELCAIGKTSEDISDALVGQDTTYKMEWGLDVDFLETNVSTYRSGTLSEEQRISLEQKNDILERAAALYIKACLNHLNEEGSSVSEMHIVYLLKWMQSYLISEPCQALLFEMSPTSSMQILREVQTAGVEGEALSRVGNNLSSVLRGKIDPLSLLLEDGLLHRLYLDDSSLQCCSHLSKYVNHLIFKNPYMTVLEIGAGTGGTTLPLLRALGENTSFIKQYDYTDISSGFFESARSKLCDWSEMLRFKTLDIERDPIDQGFEKASYDLIIASNSLHATKCINDTLANVRKLLKPGGRLALIEVTRLVPFINIIVGLLPGWWRGFEDGRQDCPLLSVEQWDRALSRSSFTGVGIAAQDFEGPGSKATMMISSTPKLRSSTVVATVEILCGHTLSKHCQSLSAQLSLVLKEQGFHTNVAPWPSHQVSKDSVYVVLDSCERPLLAESQEEQFRQTTKLITQGRRVFWITLQEDLSATTHPGAGLVTGLARVARSENELLKFVTLDVQQCVGLDRSKLSRTISDVIIACFGIVFESEKPQDEYAYRNNELLIPRLIPDARISACVEAACGNPKIGSSLFYQPHRPLKLHVGQPGLLDSLIFVDDESALEPLGEDELQIRVMACGINFKDVFVALGRMKASTQMAGECAGIVTAVGSNLQTHFQIGNRVCAWNGTPYASRSRVNGSDAYIMPNSMPFTTGASIPVVFLTAYYSLIEVAHLQKDQTILIHAASGGVGQASLMIAQHIGAKIYATAGSAAKRRFIMERYRISETNIFSSQSRVFKKGILRLTQGRGVDMILNSLSGNALEDSWECIAKFGVFVEIGKTDIYRKAQINMEPFDRNTTFASVDMVAVATHRPEKIRLMLAAIMSMFESGALRAVQPITTMAMTDIESAFRYIQARKHTGKVVLEVGDDTLVKAVYARPTSLRFDGNGTYVVAGGLGDIGQSICRLMASRGAKNVLILSRRVLDPNSQRLVEMTLAPYGVKPHVVICDIGDSRRVQEIVAWCHETMPPVKGIIQAAMALQDRTLEQMTMADFRIALYPKLYGNINLSKAFESPDLDFFIMLSSAAGIVGTKAQGNYAAASAFQDAMAHCKSDSSTHYLSLDLGMINDSNAIALHAERRRSLIRQGLIPLKLEHVIALMEYSMSAPARQDRYKQLAIGFNRQSLSSQQRSRTLQNQIFSHLPYEADRGAGKQVSRTTVSVKEAINAAANIGEIHSIVAGAICRQLSALLALEYDKISLDASITDFGLDSLIAVELRNWITRTLQAAIQTSDILDAPSLRALIETVSSKSVFVLAYREVVVLNDVQGTVSPSGNYGPIEAQVTVPIKLLPNPLPDLENTLQLYLYSVRAFLSNEELEKTLKAIRDLQKSAGFGQILQSRLAQRTKDPQIDNWLYDLYNAHVYLKVRAPVNPFQHFFGSHVATQVHHSQAERAAIISVVAFGFKQRLDENELGPDFLNEQPLCMDSLQWLFNSTRRPCVTIDRLQRFPGNDYLVALRHGHYYKIMLKDGDSCVSFAYLKSKFQGILERDHEYAPSIAALTACDRNDWAKLRDMVQEASEINRTLMGLIDAAAFIVCLDDGSPSSPTERANQFLVGKISNRWSDKILQFVVCENGASAYLCEHAIVDGGTVKQINESIKSAILGHNKEMRCEEATNHLDYHSDEIEDYAFDSNPEIDISISRVEKHFNAAVPAIEYSHFACTSFGTNFLRNHRCAPKAGYQLIIQLASLRYFGYQPPSWETISMRPFYKGRVEIIQTVLPPLFDFCASMQAKTRPASYRRSLFYEAAKVHTNTTIRISRGGGFASHLYALQEVVENGEELPLLFSDPTYANTRPKKIMTSCVPWQDSLQEAGFLLPDPENLFVHYEVDDERCRFSIQGPVGRTGVFFDLVRAAAEEVKCLLEEE